MGRRRKLTRSHPDNSYIPTVFDNFETTFTVDSQPCFTILMDTAGQEEFGTLRRTMYNGATVFVVCFSIESKAALENVRLVWLPELAEHAKDVPFIVVGTKSDLRDNASFVKEREAMNKPLPSVEALRDMALATGARAYVECSAMNGGVNVRTVFEEAVRASRKGVAEVAARRAKERESTREKSRRASAAQPITADKCCSVQ